MSSIVVSGDTSGSCTLVAPAVAGGTVLTLPAVSGTVLTSATGQTLTSPVIAGTPTGVGVLTSGTAVASTSGTSIDFTGIPSWVKRITVMFSGVSTNGTSKVGVQIGSGSALTTGYNASTFGGVSGISPQSYTTLFGVDYSGVLPGTNDTRYGTVILNNISSNIWVCGGTIAFVGGTGAGGCVVGGSNATLSGTLDRVRITTVNGTDTFDAGSINIMYE